MRSEHVDSHDKLVEDNGRLDHSRSLILSLKPHFAAAILDGSKTVELRRVRPRIAVPATALVYASSPRKALLGICTVQKIEALSIADLWSHYELQVGVDYKQFSRYFTGVSVGVGITLSCPEPLPQQIPLADIRERDEGFRPPQSFAYLDSETVKRILGSTMRTGPSLSHRMPTGKLRR